MNSNATARQKRFHKWCREFGCIVTGDDHAPILHHITGAKSNLKGVRKFGEWNVIPVCYWWHDNKKNPDAIHVNKSRFVTALGKTEKDYWLELMQHYHYNFGEYPMDEEEYEKMRDRG